MAASRFYIVVFHVTAWLLYQAPFYFIGFNQAKPMSFGHYMWWTVDNLLLDLSIFYSFYLFFIPKWLEKNKALPFILLVLVLLLVYPWVKFHLDVWVHGMFPGELVPVPAHPPYSGWNHFLIRAVAPFFLIAMSGIARFTVDWFQNIKIKAALENERLSSELDFLKSQMNPHFLFNSLNNIYSMAYANSPVAAKAIMKLSEIMRYMIYESNEKNVPLSKEVEHIMAYIELNELRLKRQDVAKVEIDSSIRQSETVIAPLVLSPFIENAFKHGNLMEGNGIKVVLSLANNELYLMVENKVIPQHKKDAVGGVGLRNVQRRLALIYKDQYELKIETTETLYTVKLTIQL